jgi:hypothetical protein
MRARQNSAIVMRIWTRAFGAFGQLRNSVPRASAVKRIEATNTPEKRSRAAQRRAIRGARHRSRTTTCAGYEVVGVAASGEHALRLVNELPVGRVAMVLAPAAGAVTGTSWVSTSATPSPPALSCAETAPSGCSSLSDGAAAAPDASWCPTRRAARRQSLRRWRPHASCDNSAAKTPPTTARQDPADRVGAEPTVLDIAPAVDLPKHRAEAAIGGVHPIEVG